MAEKYLKKPLCIMFLAIPPATILVVAVVR